VKKKEEVLMIIMMCVATVKPKWDQGSNPIQNQILKAHVTNA
jgi:hypothetical protein